MIIISTVKIGKLHKKISTSTSQVFHPETEISQIVDFPEIYNNDGKFLTTNGIELAWATVDALPSQASNNGKYLITDGTDASWAELPDFLLRSGGTLTGNIYGRPVVGSSSTATGDDLPVLFVSKDNTLNKGGTVSKARYFTLGTATDATGLLTNEHKFGQVQVSINTSGKISTELIAYRNQANNTTQAKIAISQETNGTIKTEAPTPPANDNSTQIATTAWVNTAIGNIDALPEQTNNSGKFLTTNGTTASWATVDALPSQLNNSGKFLTTDGSTASWTDVFAGEVRVSSTHYPSTSDTTITLTSAQTPETGIEKWGLSVYRDGIYLVQGIDYTYASNSKVLTFTRAFGTDEVVSVNFAYLSSDSDTSSANSLPAQTGQSGKFLTTDGLDASWTNIPEYTLPTASSSTLGGVKIGDGITITDGVISADSQLPTQTSNSGKFLTTNGTTASWSNVPEYTLVTATTSSLGGIKVGDRLSIDSNGFLSANDQLPTITGNSGKFLTTNGSDILWGDTPEYTLPTASSSTLGGIKVGSGLSISSGVLSANNQLPSQTNNSGKYLTTNGTSASWSNIPVTGVTTTGNGNVITSITDNGSGQLSATKGITVASLESPAFTGTPTAPTATAGDNSTQIATTAYVDGAVSNLVNSAPAALDTLNELAEALGNDPNFATTVSTSLGNKLDSSSANYIKSLSISGKTITYTKGNNTTGTLTTQDTTYTQGTGITISNGVISANSQLPSQTNNAGKYLYTDGSSISWEDTPEYTLPEATTSNLGGVIVGDGLSVTADGTISVDAQLPVQTNNNGKYLTTNGTSASWASIPEYSTATTSAAGLMAPEDKTKLDAIENNANNYSLPIASSSTLGGIKVGTNLSIDSSTGVLSATDTITTVTVTGSGNAVTNITDSNGALTATKGSTFSLSTHNHNGTYVKLTGSGTSDHITGTLCLDDAVIKEYSSTKTRADYNGVNSGSGLISLHDSNGNSLGTIYNSMKMTSSSNYYNEMSMFVYDPTLTNFTYQGLTVGYNQDGVYTKAPTPATSDNSTKIATTAFVKAQGYITSSSDITGNAATATTASTLGTVGVGSATQPIYLDNGVPTATTYTLGKSVPSDAVFTDTVYTHPTSSGNKHIPSGGSSGQVLVWSADGTAAWSNASDSALPAQTNNSGKYLTTNGTSASWSEISSISNTLKAQLTQDILESLVNDTENYEPSESQDTITLSAAQQGIMDDYDTVTMTVYMNGVRLDLGDDYTYSSSTYTLTFTEAFDGGEKITVVISYIDGDVPARGILEGAYKATKVYDIFSSAPITLDIGNFNIFIIDMRTNSTPALTVNIPNVSGIAIGKEFTVGVLLGSNVPTINWGSNTIWDSTAPTFEANKSYSISFLQMSSSTKYIGNVEHTFTTSNLIIS